MIRFLSLLSSLATAAPAPRDPGLPRAAIQQADLDEVDAWEARGRVLLDGPDACVEVQGTARVDVVLYTPGGWLGPGERRKLGASGSFTGTLDHGLWTALDASFVQDNDDNTLTIEQVQPIVGRLPQTDTDDERGHISVGASDKGTAIDIGAGSRQAMNLLDRIIDEIDPSITTSYALWDPTRDAVVLRQFVPFRDDGSPEDLEIRTFFPQAGAPTALDAVFPKRLAFHEGPITIKVLNAQAHLRAKDTALGTLPGVESTSLIIGVLGYTVGFEQRLAYERARPCR